MAADAATALVLLLTALAGVFVGHRWATESRRFDDFIERVRAEKPGPSIRGDDG